MHQFFFEAFLLFLVFFLALCFVPFLRPAALVALCNKGNRAVSVDESSQVACVAYLPLLLLPDLASSCISYTTQRRLNS